MKLHIITGCALLAASMSLMSCSDFLDETPKGKLTPPTYFSTQDELNMSLNSLYTIVTQSQIYTNMQYPQWQGDDITANPGSNKQACREIDQFAVSDNQKGVRDAWNAHYKIIKAANYIIDNAERTPTSQDQINIALGQAKFWRAYAYYYLVRLYGPLPLILHDVDDNNQTQLSSVADVYKQIVQDLTDCDNYNLPASYSGQPRNINGCDVFVTQQAVKSTLASVYLSMAGYPLNLGKEYYAKAATMAKQVIDGVESGKYDAKLNSEWKEVYSYGNNYNKETILGINFSPTKNWSTDSELSSCNLFESHKGWGDGIGEIKFWMDFPEGPRKDAVYSPKLRYEVKTKDSDGNDQTSVVFYDWWQVDENGKALVPEQQPEFCVFTINAENGKEVAAPYDYTKAPYTGMCTDTRHQLIRYSEVLLWYAEATARSGGDLTLAKKYLKTVRSRAVNAADVNTVDGVSIDAMTADQLATAAWKEHGWEVAGYWVALATRRSDEFRMNHLKENFAYRAANAPVTIQGVKVQEKVPVTGSWNDNMNYMPYPSTEVEKNPNLKR